MQSAPNPHRLGASQHEASRLTQTCVQRTGCGTGHGAAAEEIMEAIWVAAEMRAGGAYAHSVLAIEEIEKAAPKANTNL